MTGTFFLLSILFNERMEQLTHQILTQPPRSRLYVDLEADSSPYKAHTKHSLFQLKNQERNQKLL